MRTMVVIAALAAAGCASQAAASPKPTRATAEAQFERLKALEGRWRSTMGSPMQGMVEYRVVSNESAVQETAFPGTSHEMISMYTVDGNQLVMTHYCALGNQPRMRAVPSGDPREIRFEFAGLGGGDASQDMHIHEGGLAFGEDGLLRSHWRSWNEGKPAEFEAKLELARAP